LEKQWASGISDRYDLRHSGIKLTGVKIDRVNRHLSWLNECNPRVLTTVCEEQLKVAKLASSSNVRATVKEVQQGATLKFRHCVR
jgi:hypothetical protein